jgi:hypothetical protein
MKIYDNMEHVEEDLRRTVCYRNGGQRCSCGSEQWQTLGWCNKQERFPYDDRWLTLKAEMEEELKDECVNYKQHE